MPNTFQDKPLASDLLSNSQGDLKQNFDYIQGALGKDHQIVFGHTDTGTTFEGRHLQVSLKAAASATPGFVGDGTDSEIFSFNGNLYYQSNAMNSAAVNPTQLTNANYTAAFAANPGYTFLPGGLLLQWGSQAGSLPLTVTYPIAFTTAFQVTAISSDNARPIGISVVGNSNFTYLMANPSALVTVRWFAIGAK